MRPIVVGRDRPRPACRGWHRTRGLRAGGTGHAGCRCGPCGTLGACLERSPRSSAPSPDWPPPSWTRRASSPRRCPGCRCGSSGRRCRPSLKLQQQYSGLVARGDEVFTGLRGEDEPGLATFDDERPRVLRRPAPGRLRAARPSTGSTSPPTPSPRSWPTSWPTTSRSPTSRWPTPTTSPTRCRAVCRGAGRRRRPDLRRGRRAARRPGRRRGHRRRGRAGRRGRPTRSPTRCPTPSRTRCSRT